VPYRLRVRISRKRNDEEGAKEKLYSYVQAVNVKNPKGLQTAVVSSNPSMRETLDLANGVIGRGCMSWDRHYRADSM